MVICYWIKIDLFRGPNIKETLTFLEIKNYLM
jgi:hypothetical protein